MNYKTTFKSGIKGEFLKHKEKPFNPQDPTLFQAAVAQGYDDAKRTFTNIGEVWKANPQFREEFFKAIAEKIQEIFIKSPAKGFDDWHKETCDLFLNMLLQKGYENATYGQAQKVINLAFKYLYCLDGAETYGEVFDLCHMPLDGFTLEWFYRQCKYGNPEKKIVKGKMDKWSALAGYGDERQDVYQTTDKKEHYTYFFYQKQIREWLAKGQTPLQTEFEIWSEIQKHRAAEAFLFSLIGPITKAEKDKILKRSLKEKLDEIEKHLSNWR